MKICIWCRQSSPQVTFFKKAHTFPDSLNGKNICENVCDTCNHYFGSPTPDGPSVEVILKEALNVSKYLLFHQIGKLPKNKRFKSEFFTIDWKQHKIKPKFKYRLNWGFQQNAGKQFRRGLYKVFLEERERQKKDALDERFDFIREFARYNFGDFPIFYFKPKFQAILFSLPDITEPTIRFTEYSEITDSEFRIFEYQIMGHYFAIPTSRVYNLTLANYLKKIDSQNHPFGQKLIPINRFEDLDFSFHFFNSNA